MSNTSMTLTEFERLLDVYGGDRTRWPMEARAAAAHLVARHADAQRLLGEAEALDRVLERAPLPALAKEAVLADRIVAAAQRSPRIVKIGGDRPAERALPAAAPVGRSPLRFSRANVGAAWLLVASLMIGVVIGREPFGIRAVFATALTIGGLLMLRLSHTQGPTPHSASA